MGIFMQISFLELRDKDVVNITDGKKLGRIQDMMFTKCGQVTGFIVPGEKKFLKCIARDECIFIPYGNICKIGEDIVLVELKTDCPVPCDQQT